MLIFYFLDSDRKSYSGDIKEAEFTKSNNNGYQRHNNYNKKYFRHFSQSINMPKMSKEERRLLFEKKHKEMEATSMANSLNPSTQSPLTPAELQKSATPESYQNLKWMFDVQSGKWIQVYCNTPADSSLAASMQLMQSQSSFYENYNDPNWNLKFLNSQNQSSAQIYFYPNMALNQPPPPPPPIFEPPKIDNLQLTESNLKDFKNAVEQFLPSAKVDDKLEIPLPPPPPPPKKKEKRKLPANWKHARNSEGRIYYYNKITKKSQWHFPRFEQQKEDLDPSPASPPPLSLPNETTTITTADASTTLATTAATDQSLKRRRDTLRDQLSKLVVKLLTPYLKDNCKNGHITNNEDFKHLARKFTHSILEKEQTRTNDLDNVELSKRVKIKAEEYISKYMIKFNGDYSRKKDDS